MEVDEEVALDSFDVEDSLRVADDDEVLDAEDEGEVRPLPNVDDDDDRESVMYQPVPLNTMPTG